MSEIRTRRRGRRPSGGRPPSSAGPPAGGTRTPCGVLDRDWDRFVTFYQFPREHWSHLRTSNPVESPFAALRLRTDAAKRFKKVANARAIIWKLLLVAERRFRRLTAPERATEVYLGVKFVNGVKVTTNGQEVAA